MSITAILLAAGSGSRMLGSVDDKVLAPLNGKPVLLHSIEAFLAAGYIDQFTIVYRDEPQRVALEAALEPINLKNTTVTWALGGKERQDSVLNALEQQDPSCDYVFIHDGARPLITPASLRQLYECLKEEKAVVLAHPVIDTVKRLPAAGATKQVLLEDLDRSRLWAMETPQAFTHAGIISAYRHVRANGLSITDDTAAAATIGIKSTLVENSHPNPKITTPADLKFTEWLCQHGEP
jgi:2-C-methyl-D-erythritol 4-phosphate cytidylyltransferase